MRLSALRPLGIAAAATAVLLCAAPAAFAEDNPTQPTPTVEQVPVEAAGGTLPDTDGDGINDAQEIELGLNPAAADSDGDGLDDFAEIARYGTNPHVVDSDGDGLADGREVELGTLAYYADSDGDRITDGVEVNETRTNPARKDTDGDLLWDYAEVTALGTNPTKADAAQAFDGDPAAKAYPFDERPTVPFYGVYMDGTVKMTAVKSQRVEMLGEVAVPAAYPDAAPVTPDADSDGWSDDLEAHYGSSPSDALSYPGSRYVHLSVAAESASDSCADSAGVEKAAYTQPGALLDSVSTPGRPGNTNLDDRLNVAVAPDGLQDIYTDCAAPGQVSYHCAVTEFGGVLDGKAILADHRVRTDAETRKWITKTALGNGELDPCRQPTKPVTPPPVPDFPKAGAEQDGTGGWGAGLLALSVAGAVAATRKRSRR